jgi:hypothetical protein
LAAAVRQAAGGAVARPGRRLSPNDRVVAERSGGRFNAKDCVAVRQRSPNGHLFSLVSAIARGRSVHWFTVSPALSRTVVAIPEVDSGMRCQRQEETTMKTRRDPGTPRSVLARVCRAAVTTALVRASGNGGWLGLPAGGGCDRLTTQLNVVGLLPPAEPSTWPGPTKNTMRSTSASSRDPGGITGRESKAAAVTLALVRCRVWKITRYPMLAVVRPLRMWATKTGYRGRHRLNPMFDR